jgi:23S rRNA (guanosine2251-2'-O)-methyltransferase
MPKQVVLAGFHAVNARAKLNPDSIRVVYVEASRRDKRMQQCKDRLAAAGVKVMQADAKRLEGMAPGIPHQGIVALADELKQTLDFDTLLDSITPDTLLLVLDGVTELRRLPARGRCRRCSGSDCAARSFR